MTRERLPDRRPSETRAVAWRGGALAVTAGFDPATGAVREVFASGYRFGSDLQATIDDACVIVSIALQHGARPAELRRSLGTVPALGDAGPGEEPASVLGAIVGALLAFEDRA
jgi:hypothetical protein